MIAGGRPRPPTPDEGVSGYMFIAFSVPPVVHKNKKPAEPYASAGLGTLCLLANSATHTRHRAVRVMMVVMVPGQHERLTLREAEPRVNSENSIRVIGFSDVGQQPAVAGMPVRPYACTSFSVQEETEMMVLRKLG